MSTALKVIYYSEMPSLHEQAYDSISKCWDTFLFYPDVAIKYKKYLAENLSEYQFFVLDECDNILAFGKSVPTYWDGHDSSLPDGYDAGLELAVDISRTKKLNCNTLQALSINVFNNSRGLGLGSFCIKVMKEICKKHGFHSLIAPVRPGSKINFPEMDLNEYVKLKDEKNVIYDIWLRTFEKYGGRQATPITNGMVVTGTIKQWENWTKMKFSKSGFFLVESGLAPVQIILEADKGIYWDPCVWYVVPIESI